MKNKDCQSCKVSALCLNILFVGILVDLIIKFNFYSFSESIGETLRLFAIESCLLITVFYLKLFGHAKKGILIGSRSETVTAFPAKKYALISLIFSSVLTFGLWLPRFFIYLPSQMIHEIILYLCLVLFTLLLAFGVAMISFRAAFSVAVKHDSGNNV